MILVIDVGNTNTVLGLMNGSEIVQSFRITTTSRTTDEYGLIFLELFRHHGLGPGDIDGSIISSVVPAALYNIPKACRRYLDTEPLIVGKSLKTGIKVRMDNPREVGADRIVNAVAAVERFGAPVIVVDFGTATTFDCVNAEGEYVGGVIAPGIQISAEALYTRTAKLPRVEFEKPPHAIGRNTVHAMQSGLYWGYVALVDGLAKRCRDELDPEAPVVATGGLATAIGNDAKSISEVDTFLTLRGLALLFERNRR